MYEEIKDSDAGKDLQDAYNNEEQLPNGISDMADTRMMSIADSIKCGLQTFSTTAKYNRGDRFVYEGNVCEVTDVSGDVVVNLDYNRSILADDSAVWREYPHSNRRRLVCEYCGCISDKEHGTCEHCGAPLKEME